MFRLGSAASSAQVNPPVNAKLLLTADLRCVRDSKRMEFMALTSLDPKTSLIITYIFPKFGEMGTTQEIIDLLGRK